MTRLLLLRHAQSEWNALGLWQGQADPPLSREGEAAARRAAGRLRGFRGPVVASTLRRAMQTAEIMAEVLGLGAVIPEPDLREIDVGDWSGRTREEIEELYPGALEAWRAGRLERPHNGEARAAFRTRVLGAVERLARSYPGAEVLVVTHGGAIAALERITGVFPGEGVGNLCGRWFEVCGSVRACGERVALDPGEPR